MNIFIDVLKTLKESEKALAKITKFIVYGCVIALIGLFSLGLIYSVDTFLGRETPLNKDKRTEIVVIHSDVKKQLHLISDICKDRLKHEPTSKAAILSWCRKRMLKTHEKYFVKVDKILKKGKS